MINMTFQGKNHHDLLNQVRDFVTAAAMNATAEQETISTDPVSKESATSEFTLEDLKKLVSRLAKTDRQQVKDIFAKFDATRLANVNEEHHSRLHQLLTEAVDNG